MPEITLRPFKLTSYNEECRIIWNYDHVQSDFWKTILMNAAWVWHNGAALSLSSHKTAGSSRLWHSKVKYILPSLKPLSIMMWMSFVTGTLRRKHLMKVIENKSVSRKGDTSPCLIAMCVAMIHSRIFNSIFSSAEISKNILIRFLSALFHIVGSWEKVYQSNTLTVMLWCYCFFNRAQ